MENKVNVSGKGGVCPICEDTGISIKPMRNDCMAHLWCNCRRKKRAVAVRHDEVKKK